MIFVIILFKNAWLMRNQGSQSNSMHAQNISIHTVTLDLYFTSSFNDSFIQDSVETHVQEIINEDATRI